MQYPIPSGRPDAFPDESLPAGSVVDGALLAGDVQDAFDYVVIGSGAAGAVAAHVLAKSGASVAIVEEGPWVRTRQFGERVYDAFRRLFRDAGMQVMEGRAYIPLLQGRCVGGGPRPRRGRRSRTSTRSSESSARRRSPTRPWARTTAGSSTRPACTACPRGERIATSTGVAARGVASPAA